jgi:3-methyladenine DNA glycosylase/8-oxoguanine DNA glycosylase
VLLRLPFVGPYDWSLALRMIGAHAVPGAERLDPSSGAYTRLLAGPTGRVAVTVRPDHQAIVVDTTDAGVATRIRHWLDLDLAPADVATRFEADETLGPLVRERPGLRRIRYPETFEAVVSTVLGQQVSLAAARTFAGRLTAAFGTPGPRRLTAFPTAQRMVQEDPAELQRTLGITGARARTLRAVAELFCEDGDWPVPLPVSDWDAAAARLLALPGIGPWTIGYLRMRLFGDPDVVPVGDLVLRRALGVTDDRDVAPATQRWRPERTYATFQLWASAAW